MFWVAALKAWNFISYKILFVCKTKSATHLYIYTAICPFHITISNYAILHISYSQRVNIVAFSWSFHRFKFFRKKLWYNLRTNVGFMFYSKSSDTKGGRHCRTRTKSLIRTQLATDHAYNIPYKCDLYSLKLMNTSSNF